MSDSTPAAVVTEIDEDSAITEAHDSLRVLLTQWKRQSIEMNAPSLEVTAGGGMQVEDDIGDLDETQALEPAVT